MRYSSAFLDEVRDRVKLSSIVGTYVIWDKKKTRTAKGDFWACCPFHGEKTPSFHVDDRKGIFHCFGCGVNGDGFRFLMERANQSFPEAVETMAARAGMELPKHTEEAQAAAAKRLTLVQANTLAATWFQQQLRESPAARDYAASRGLTPQELTAFGIGYAPAGNAMTKAHIGGDDELVAAGVLGRSETGGRLYDRFSDRLMFPIADARGHVLGFAGRDLSGSADAKYLNTAQTEIFDKGAILYNFGPAKEAAWNGATAVTVEGQLDVIAATRAGLAAVAPMGTALTENHVPLLRKLSEEPVLCFDGDAAGIKAANRAIDLILPVTSPAFTARVAVLPDGEDPDSMVRKNPGRFVQTVQAAKPLADALWARETTGQSVAQPEDYARVTFNLRVGLEKITDRDTRRAYGADFKDRLRTLGERPRVFRSNSYSQHSTSPSANRLLGGFQESTGWTLKEAILIGAIAAAPQAALDRAEELSADTRLSYDAVDLIGKLVMALSAAPEQAVTEVIAAAGLQDAVDDALAKAAGAGVAMQIGGEGLEALNVIRGLRRH